MTWHVRAVFAAVVLLTACETRSPAPESSADDLPAMRVDLSEPAPSTPAREPGDLIEQRSPVEGGGVFVDLGDQGIRHGAAPSTSESVSTSAIAPVSARRAMAGLRAPGSLPSQNFDVSSSAVSEMPVGASRSALGLVETQSPVEGGGVMIDLQGRFMSFTTIETGPNGEQVMRCRRGQHPAGVMCPDCSGEETN